MDVKVRVAGPAIAQGQAEFFIRGADYKFFFPATVLYESLDDLGGKFVAGYLDVEGFAVGVGACRLGCWARGFRFIDNSGRWCEEGNLMMVWAFHFVEVRFARSCSIVSSEHEA